MNVTDIINKNKNTAINAGIVILACVIALNIYKVQAQKARNLKAAGEVEEKKNVLLNDINKLAKEYATYNNMLGMKEVPVLINNLGEIAKTSGVRIVSIKPAPPLPQPIFVKYPFELSISAETFHALGSFISKVESSTNIYTIDYLDIKPGKEGNKSVLVASIRVSALGGKK